MSLPIPALTGVVDLLAELAPIGQQLIRGAITETQAHKQVMGAFERYQTAVRDIEAQLAANDAEADAAAAKLPSASPAPPAPAPAPAPAPEGTP